MTTYIPTIDISSYLDGTDKEGVATKINEACEEIGFFMIQGHGIDLNLLNSIHTISNKFFDLPLSTKIKLSAPFGLGYIGVGKENHALTLKEQSEVKDYKESLNITLPISDEIWPDDETLRTVCERYYKEVAHLSSQMMKLFALALKQEESFFDKKIDNAFTVLRMLNYPEYEIQGSAAESSNENGESKLVKMNTRNGEHTDYGSLTVLWSPDSRGLQAKSRSGQWIDVIAPKDQFIINIGDLMMHWTNEKWVSTLHRVVPHPETKGKRRASFPFFHMPNPDALIECIESCCDDANPPKEPILVKTHLEMKVSKALGKEEKMS